MSLNGYDRKLVNLIPPDADYVLEYGCGNGARASYYRRRNPAATYIGIEPDSRTSAQAGSVLSRVYASPDDFLSAETEHLQRIDCLIVQLHRLPADAADPASILQRFITAVRPAGVVLLAWRPDREQPRSEARLKSELQRAKAIIQSAGLYLSRIVQSGAARHPRTRQAGLTAFILRAVPELPARHLSIQAMTLAPVAACNDIRIHEPALCLDTIPGVEISADVNSVKILGDTAGLSRILIWQRPILQRPASVQTLRKLIRAGYLIIVDFDDDPRRWQKIVDHDYLSFRGVHCVQTSTPALAEFLRQFNPEVEIFHNQIMELPPLKPSRPDTGTVHLFFGALNREADWKPVMPALNRVLKKSGPDVHVNVIHDRQFYDQLETPAKTFHPTCGYARYRSILQDCDIGLLPLAATEFNRYKSDLKFIEFAAHEVVALASPTVYSDSIRDGETGVLFGDAAAFEAGLTRLIADRDMRLHMAAQARNWVSGHRLLGRHFRKRYEWYGQMLQQLPALNAALRARLPELFD